MRSVCKLNISRAHTITHAPLASGSLLADGRTDGHVTGWRCNRLIRSSVCLRAGQLGVIIMIVAISIIGTIGSRALVALALSLAAAHASKHRALVHGDRVASWLAS